MPFHIARFTRGGFLNKPIESHADYTQRGKLMQLKPVESIALGVKSCQCLQVKKASVSSQASELGHMSSGVEVYQGSEHDPWYSQAQALGGQSSEYL